MKYCIIAILLLGPFAFSKGQSIDCKPFHIGYFNNIGSNSNGKVDTHIKRTKKFQYEYVGEMKIKLGIQWTNDCTYELTFIKANKAFWKSQGKNGALPVVVCEIISVDGNKCAIRGKIAGAGDFDYSSTNVKVN